MSASCARLQYIAESPRSLRLCYTPLLSPRPFSQSGTKSKFQQLFPAETTRRCRRWLRGQPSSSGEKNPRSRLPQSIFASSHFPARTLAILWPLLIVCGLRAQQIPQPFLTQRSTADRLLCRARRPTRPRTGRCSALQTSRSNSHRHLAVARPALHLFVYLRQSHRPYHRSRARPQRHRRQSNQPHLSHTHRHVQHHGQRRLRQPHPHRRPHPHRPIVSLLSTHFCLLSAVAAPAAAALAHAH